MRAFSTRAAAADVVLLDLRLPDSDDWCVLTAMHALSPTTPIIIMTVHGGPELFEEARHLGAFDVVDKPFEMSDLPRLVERALTKRPS